MGVCSLVCPYDGSAPVDYIAEDVAVAYCKLAGCIAGCLPTQWCDPDWVECTCAISKGSALIPIFIAFLVFLVVPCEYLKLGYGAGFLVSIP